MDSWGTFPGSVEYEDSGGTVVSLETWREWPMSRTVIVVSSSSYEIWFSRNKSYKFSRYRWFVILNHDTAKII